MSVSTLTVDYGHVELVSVHYDDFDPMGVVHNARYALLLERAVIPYWERRGHAFAAGRPSTSDAFMAVREFTITYHTPILGTGEIAVHFWLEQLGSSSGVYGFRLQSVDGSTLHAEGQRVVIKLDPATMRPAPWSDDARAIALGLARTPGADN